MSSAFFKVVHPVSAGQAQLEAYEVFLEYIIEPTQFPSLEKDFDRLIGDWVKHSKALGGLKKYLVSTSEE
jgi:hypothetical protein